MKHQMGGMHARSMLVGVLISVLALDHVAAGRLFQQCCRSRECRPRCPTTCPPLACRRSFPPTTNICNPGVTTGTSTVASTVTSGGEFVFEPFVADSCCPTGVSEGPIDLVIEEPIIAPEMPSKPAGPGIVESYGPSDAIGAPEKLPPDQKSFPPTQLAVPEIEPAPQALPPAEVVSDRYSKDFVLPKPSAPAADLVPQTDPAPADKETQDPFDEPTPAKEDAPQQEIPESQPKIDSEYFFGPSKPNDTEDSEDEPNDSEQKDSELPAPAEPKDQDEDDLFGQQVGTSVLATAGGLRSDASRTWTDETTDSQFRARLVRVTTENVTLRSPNGKKIAVPLVRLSDDDLMFVHQQVVALRVARARNAAAEKLAVAWTR